MMPPPAATALQASYQLPGAAITHNNDSTHESHTRPQHPVQSQQEHQQQQHHQVQESGDQTEVCLKMWCVCKDHKDMVKYFSEKDILTF